MVGNIRKTILLSILILFIGIFGFWLLMQKGDAPTRTTPPTPARAVDVKIARFGPRQPQIRALGRVRSAGAFDLAVQVSGKILWTADPFGLKPGLKLKRGELICLVDTADYALELRRLEAGLRLAEEQHALARESSELARRDVERIEALQQADNASPQALEQTRKAWLASREKELGLAWQIGPEGTLSLARDKARLLLDRCSLRAPFDCEISSGELVPGSLVGSGAVVARLENMERLEVRVQLRDEEAEGLPEPGSARVNLWGQGWKDQEPVEGRFVHLGSSIDPVSQQREARVELRGGTGLRPGMLVEVAFPGRVLPQALMVPRSSLQANGDLLLWRAARLERVPASVIYSDRQWAYLSAGPQEGDTLVLTPIQDAIPGLPLRLRNDPARTGGPGAEGARP